MGVDWKGLIVGGLGVVALFTGADYLTKKSQSKSFNAEDWSGNEEDVPLAIDYFCAVKILENDGYKSKKANKQVKTQMTKKVFPFLVFDRKMYSKGLHFMIESRLEYYAQVYQTEGRQMVEADIFTLREQLSMVSSEELDAYFKKEAFKATLRGLPELPQGTWENGVRVRFAPNPNGPLSMGHSFGIIVNDTYAKAYNGDYILRLDDTDPDQKRPVRKLYNQILEEFEFLTDRNEGDYELHIASERKSRYIEIARKLIAEGKAYVSCIPHKSFTEKYQQYLTPKEIAEGKSPMQSAQGMPSPDRDKDVETNLRQFNEMVKLGYYYNEDGTPCNPTEGHINENSYYKDYGTLVPTVWLKTSMNEKTSKYRDMKIMRATFRTHPNDDEGKVWPYLNFQGAVDDYDLKITHMIRGCDLWETEIAYPLIWNAIGWDTAELPTFMYWPRLFFSNFSIPYTDVETGKAKELRAIGTSKMARLIANQPEFGGNWCHPSFPTVCSYMARGYPASYLSDFWLGDVWGKTCPFFNGDSVMVNGVKYNPLTKKMGEHPIEMRIGEKKLGIYKSQQAQVPYPLTQEGMLRNTPSAIIDGYVPIPMTA